MAKVKFTGTNEHFGVGKPFHALAYQAVLANAERSYNDGNVAITVSDASAVTVQDVVDFISMGGSVEGYPVFIKLSADDYNSEVPEYLRHSTATSQDKDQFGNVTIEKRQISWAEWRDATHEHHKAANGTIIVPGNSWGEELSADEIKSLADDSYTLLSESEFNAVMLTDEE